MTFARIRPPGGWTDNSVIDDGELEDFDENLSNAIDGAGGGAYAPSAAIEVGGQGIDVLTPTRTAQVVPKSYADDHNAASFTPSATALASGKLTLANALTHTGYSLASNEITVPKAGRYRVSLRTYLQVSSTSNPSTALVVLYKGATEAAYFLARRFSATAGDAFLVSGDALVDITDPATQKLSLQNESGSSLTTSDQGSFNAITHSLTVQWLGIVP